MTTMKDYWDYAFLLENFPYEKFNIETVMKHVTQFCADIIQDKDVFRILLEERMREVEGVKADREERFKWESIDA